MEKTFLKTKVAHYSFHFFAYDIVWFICIYYAAQGFRWVGLVTSVVITFIQYFWQVQYKKQSKNLFIFILYLTMVGFIGDSALIYCKIVEYNANPFIFPLAPPFMIGIWLNFSMFYYAALTWFTSRLFILSVLSFLGFVVAYFVGSAMGAAVLLKGNLSLVIIGITWSILLPISIVIFNRMLSLPKETQ